jgi:hypothetical protein
VSLFFSVVALISSLTLAYFTTLRVVDDVSMECSRAPLLDQIDELGRVCTAETQRHNRQFRTQPDAVKKMVMRAGKTCDDYAAWLTADLEPFVIAQADRLRQILR